MKKRRWSQWVRPRDSSHRTSSTRLLPKVRQQKWKGSEVIFFSLWINYLSNLAIKSHNSPSYYSLSFCYFSSFCLFDYLFKMAANSHTSFKMSSLKVPRYRELTSSLFHKILCVSVAVSELYRNEKSLLLIRNTCSSEKSPL